MATHRVDKMASTVRSIVSEVILNDLNDPRISPLTSVTRVEMTGDLQLAKVYISVLGSDSVGRRTLAGLQHACAHIQRMLAGKLQTRHCPELRIEWDASLKLGAETIELIDKTLSTDDAADRPDGESGSDDVERNGSSE